jgi:hypothetical protein
LNWAVKLRRFLLMLSGLPVVIILHYWVFQNFHRTTESVPLTASSRNLRLLEQETSVSRAANNPVHFVDVLGIVVAIPHMAHGSLN